MSRQRDDCVHLHECRLGSGARVVSLANLIGRAVEQGLDLCLEACACSRGRGSRRAAAGRAGAQVWVHHRLLESAHPQGTAGGHQARAVLVQHACGDRALSARGCAGCCATRPSTRQFKEAALISGSGGGLSPISRRRSPSTEPLRNQRASLPYSATDDHTQISREARPTGRASRHFRCQNRPFLVSHSIMCACTLDSFRNATARLASRGWWGYTIAWEGRSRLNVRWGATLPRSIEFHPPAQATRFGTLGTGSDQGRSSIASLGV
jgi:hypothetical protein